MLSWNFESKMSVTNAAIHKYTVFVKVMVKIKCIIP